MPWFYEIDPNEPQDIESAAEGAERIRETRSGLIERLSTIFRGFPGTHPDREGEAMLFPSAGAMVGTEAQRPTLPDREGHLWISIDTGRVYYGNLKGQWSLLVTGSESEVISSFRASIVKSGLQSINTTTRTRITFELDEINSHNMWDSDENELVMPFAAAINLNIELNVSSAFQKRVIFNIIKIPDGGTGVEFDIARKEILWDGTGFVSKVPVNMSIVDEVEAGDRFYLTATSNVTTPESFTVNDIHRSSSFSVLGIGITPGEEQDYDYPI